MREVVHSIVFEDVDVPANVIGRKVALAVSETKVWVVVSDGFGQETRVDIASEDLLRLYAWLAQILGGPKHDARPMPHV